jgi:hypothetical protein
MFLNKTHCKALHFYLGLKNEPWFSSASFETCRNEALDLHFFLSRHFAKKNFDSRIKSQFFRGGKE